MDDEVLAMSRRELDRVAVLGSVLERRQTLTDWRDAPPHKVAPRGSASALPVHAMESLPLDAPAAHEPEDKHDQSDHEQEVDQSAPDVDREASKPGHDQKQNNNIKQAHGTSLRVHTIPSPRSRDNPEYYERCMVESPIVPPRG
jgi:hypothetical protein